MINEFNNRIDAQRQILNLINGLIWNEELYGLSSNAIERWIRVNAINPSSDLARLVYECAEKLFFLANKSQEQITDEYRLLSIQVSELTQRVARLIAAPIN